LRWQQVRAGCREGEATTGDGQLDLIGLRRRFSDTIALDDLSFMAPRGAVCGIPMASEGAPSCGPGKQAQGPASAQIGALPL
jgi:hypothetical protein